MTELWTDTCNLIHYSMFFSINCAPIISQCSLCSRQIARLLTLTTTCTCKGKIHSPGEEEEDKIGSKAGMRWSLVQALFFQHQVNQMFEGRFRPLLLWTHLCLTDQWLLINTVKEKFSNLLSWHLSQLTIKHQEQPQVRHGISTSAPDLSQDYWPCTQLEVILPALDGKYIPPEIKKQLK